MERFNFAEILAQRCSEGSCLTDAASAIRFGSQGLGSLIRRSSGFFSSQRLEPGDRVIIACQLTPLSALAYLGALHAGLVAVPLDAKNMETEADAFLEATGARAIWVETDRDCRVTRSAAEIMLVGDTSAHPCESDAVPRGGDDLAVLIATSGTTGIPRFVMLSHGNLLANTEAIVRSQNLQNDEIGMLILPLSYCFGASILHSHLYCGGSMVFDSRFMFPDKVLKAISEHRCTTFAGVPSVYQVLLSRSNLRTIPMPSLRRFLQAGGKLEWQYIEAFASIFPAVSFYVMYGQTEACARIACLQPDRLPEKKGSVGQPLDNLQLQIADEHGNSLPPHQSGTILVKGPSISQGYWRDRSATAEVFCDGWLNTRDVGRVDDEGYLWIEGRNGEFLKVRGKRLSFGEIERRILEIDGVQDAAVCAIPHPEAGEAPVVFAVPRKGVEAEALAERIKGLLPPAWTCAGVHILEQLPLTDRGKLNRAALTERVRSMI